LSTRETVCVETPAAAAISLIVRRLREGIGGAPEGVLSGLLSVESILTVR
jgi:hypothetical protein